jgi:hypothetical protein
MSFKEPYGAEWRDPEALTLAMVLKGVLSKLPMSTGGHAEERFIDAPTLFRFVLSLARHER